MWGRLVPRRRVHDARAAGAAAPAAELGAAGCSRRSPPCSPPARWPPAPRLSPATILPASAPAPQVSAAAPRAAYHGFRDCDRKHHGKRSMPSTELKY